MFKGGRFGMEWSIYVCGAVSLPLRGNVQRSPSVKKAAISLLFGSERGMTTVSSSTKDLAVPV